MKRVGIRLKETLLILLTMSELQQGNKEYDFET